MKFKILYLNWQGKYICIHPNDTTKVGNVHHWYVFLLKNSTMLVMRRQSSEISTRISIHLDPLCSHPKFLSSTLAEDSPSRVVKQPKHPSQAFFLSGLDSTGKNGNLYCLKPWLRPEGIITSDFLFIVTTEKASLPIRSMPSHGYYSITRFFISLKS